MEEPTNFTLNFIIITRILLLYYKKIKNKINIIMTIHKNQCIIPRKKKP